MIVQKSILSQKISKLKNVVPKKPTISALQGVLVKEGYLIANNLEMTVKAKLDGMEDETFIIPMKAFDLIGNLPDGDVEVIAAAGTITIKAEKIKNTYQTMDPDMFPINEIKNEDKAEISIKSEVFLESMKHVSYAISSLPGQNIMSALCLQAGGGILNFVGLDGHVLAWDRVEYDGEFELLIPKNTVDRLLSIGLIGQVSIRHNELGAVFATEDYEISTRLIDGEYYKYQNMFKDMPSNTSVVRSELLDAMIRAKMCIEERKPVRFEFTGDVLNVSINDNTTEYHETVNLHESLEDDLTIGFDVRLVVDTLKAFDCEVVRLHLASPKMPMIVEAEDSMLKAIILPVMIG